ncbi:hypothetical protein [Nocardia sp. NPDC050175]|uniref:hypothetical protein n=1 Tax=Nocardia sp. NPDC050175 TaxID=3364317 RepID=UPI0037AB8AD2
MTAHPEPPAGGLLIVDEFGGISWWSSRLAPVPSVRLTLGPGVVAEIDPTEPDDLLAWAVQPAARPDPVADAVGDPMLSDWLASLRDLGEAVRTFDCPRLRAPWARLALTTAIGRWTTRRIHKGALLLDEAVAEHALGHRTEAEHAFAYAEYALLELGERCVDGTLTSRVTAAVAQALADAEQSGLGRPVTALRHRLAETTPVEDDDLAAMLAGWADAVAVREVPISGTGSASPEITYGHLDLTVLAPRILAWQSARDRELRIVHDQDADVFRLSAPLAADVDPYCREAQQLLAYCADNRTGAPLAVTAAQVATGSAVADLPARGNSLRTVNFGLFDADTELSALRCDPVGRALVEVDRNMVEAWNHHRAALATLAALPDNPDATAAALAHIRGEELLLVADASASTARGRLADLLDGSSGEEAETWPRNTVAARLIAIDRYRSRLPTALEPTGDAPMLVELILPDPDEGW